jgi:glutamyl-tRNA reductase
MYIVVVGVNHRTAPVEIREKLYFPENTLPGNLKQLISDPGLTSCVIISTCNRTEIYVTAYNLDGGLQATWNFLSQYSGLDISEIKNYTFCHTLYDAIRHLYRVASGLDSMVLGETQILGQVRRAFESSMTAETSNTITNTLFKQAVTVGKRVRVETEISKNAVSVSYVALELARQKYGDLKGRSVLIVGAGEMSELTAKYLVEDGVSLVIVANRSYQNAVQLAEKFNGKAIHFEELYQQMQTVDIVISSTAASHYVIHYQDVLQLINENPDKKLMLIDIAMPRDIDPLTGTIPGVSLSDIDSLQSVVDNNLDKRRQAAVVAEGIIEEELNNFMKWLSTLFVIPTITALKDRGEVIKNKELQRACNRLKGLSEQEQKIICSMANSIVNQLIHLPIIRIKEYASTTQGHLYTEVLQNLFDLEISGERPKNNSIDSPEDDVTHSI